MKNRSVAMVIILSLVTFGIYAIIWAVQTKEEMNQRGAAIPTAWLVIIPIVGIFWWWKYCEGVEKVTNKAMSGPVAFLMILLLSVIGMGIIQSKFNEVN